MWLTSEEDDGTGSGASDLVHYLFRIEVIMSQADMALALGDVPWSLISGS